MIRFLFVLPAILIVLLIRSNTPSITGDDAYMTFRVVKNALEGKGFVYNQGEYVYVTTTVLWGNVLRFFSMLFSSTPERVYVHINLFLDCLNCILVYVLSAKRNAFPLMGFFASVLFSLSWFVNYSSIIGMESSLFITIICITAYITNEKKNLVSMIFSSLACILRPEGVLLLISRYLVIFMKEKMLPRAEMIISLVVLSIFTMSCWYYFGTIIPNAAVAKKLAYHRESFQALDMLLDFLALSLYSPLQYASVMSRRAWGCIIFFVWVFGAYKEYKNKNTAHTIMSVFTLMVICFYTITNPLLFEWYVAPLTVSLVISFCWGIFHLSYLIKIRSIQRLPYAICGVIFICVISSAIRRYELPSLRLVLTQGSGGHLHWPGLDAPRVQRDAYKMATLGSDQRETLYIELAKSIENSVNEKTLVMAPEFGAFGYYTKARIISSIGHNSPEMFPFLPVSREVTGKHINNGISIEMIRHFRPDYVLSLEAFIRHGLLASEEFLAEYEIVDKRESNVFGSRGLYLFKKESERSMSK